jgi:hypothetical protein
MACTHIYVRTTGPLVVDRGPKLLLPLPSRSLILCTLVSETVKATIGAYGDRTVEKVFLTRCSAEDPRYGRCLEGITVPTLEGLEVLRTLCMRRPSKPE